MSRAVDELYQRAAELADGERAELAGLLLDSLNEAVAPSSDIEEAWAQEIARRMADYREGRVKTISWQELRAHLHRQNR
jgi:putative addiction module component (TIGR02574 family)